MSNTASLDPRVLGALPSVLHAVTIAVAMVFLLKALLGIAAGRPFDRSVLVALALTTAFRAGARLEREAEGVV